MLSILVLETSEMFLILEMKLQNNGGDRIPTGHHLSPNKVSSTRTGLHMIELLVTVVLWEPPNNPGQDYKFLSRNLQQGPIAEDNTYHEHGDVKLVSTYSLHPISHCLCYRKIVCMMSKKYYIHQAACKLLVCL